MEKDDKSEKMKKIIIVKDSGKIIWGKKSFQCKPVVKCVLKGVDFKNIIQKKRRTYWIWITFEGELRIRLGDSRVAVEDKEGNDLGSDVLYHKIDLDDKNFLCQFVSRKLSVMSELNRRALTKDEQIAVVYTEIENSRVDRRERMMQLVEVIRKKLCNYQKKVYEDYYKSTEINGVLMKKRLSQVERLENELGRMAGIIRDAYKVAQGKNIYFDTYILRDGFKVDVQYDF